VLALTLWVILILHHYIWHLVSDIKQYYQKEEDVFFVKVSSGKILKYCFCGHTFVLFVNDDILFVNDDILFVNDDILFVNDDILFVNDDILFVNDDILFVNDGFSRIFTRVFYPKILYLMSY